MTFKTEVIRRLNNNNLLSQWLHINEDKTWDEFLLLNLIRWASGYVYLMFLSITHYSTTWITFEAFVMTKYIKSYWKSSNSIRFSCVLMWTQTTKPKWQPIANGIVLDKERKMRKITKRCNYSGTHVVTIKNPRSIYSSASLQKEKWYTLNVTGDKGQNDKGLGVDQFQRDAPYIRIH